MKNFSSWGTRSDSRLRASLIIQFPKNFSLYWTLKILQKKSVWQNPSWNLDLVWDVLFKSHFWRAKNDMHMNNNTIFVPLIYNGFCFTRYIRDSWYAYLVSAFLTLLYLKIFPKWRIWLFDAQCLQLAFSR